VFKFKKKNLIYYALLAGLLLLLSSLTSPFKTPSLNILSAPFKIITFVRNEISGLIFYHRNLTQNKQLKKKIDFLSQKFINAQETYQENARLKDLLSLKQKSPYKVIASQVIARSPDSWSSLIIIDKGYHHGIKRGMVALTYLGLVGRVVETSESTSKIRLMNDADFAVSSRVQRSRQEGLVSGTQGGLLIMRYLPKDADIKISDIIITSGLTAAYPKGLVIGTVVDLGEEFSGLMRYALIKPAVNLANIEEVLVIIP
jgi:rod shape-determining protein MreC